MDLEPTGLPRDRLAPDTRVGDYRIKALLGEGATGEVYLAQDAVLGRRVALKLLRPDIAAADGVTRFLEEARATAAFSHPHIVTIHAVGDFDGRPYLALEFLDGESLRARIATAPLPERDALRTTRAIAEAVAEAHGRGVIHADLKPENVMVPRDGRVRVVDFGLARLAGSSATGASGTPSYMAPERWTGAAPTPAIDVWSLGVLLCELVTGARPLADAELARLAFGKGEPPLHLPEAGWATLVRDCLTRDPTQRPSADEVVRRLALLIDPMPHADADPACPFPGLVAFGPDDRAHYFGRGAELDAAIEALRTRPLIPVVGPSGVGKSSFVTAALIPRLEEAGWSSVVFRPGAAPFVALAVALGCPTDAARLRAEPSRVALALADCAARLGRRILVFVDQGEECWTLAGADGPLFAAALAQATTVDDPWRVVVTVRDDFLARLAEPPPMRPHLGALLVLAPMTKADLTAAIRGPLGNVGYATDTEELPARIVDDVAAQPATLALLQFACRALWERRDSGRRRLLTAAYESMGGASGALAAHAERVLAGLSPEQVRQVRRVLLALIDPDGTRRPRARRQLADGHQGDDTAAIDALIERRLIVVTRGVEDDEPVLEIAHEALATAWPRLGRWLDETHEQRLLVAEVEQAAALWGKRGRRAEETWTGPALAEATRKVEAWRVELPSESRRFLEAGELRARQRRRVRRWIVGSAVGGLTIIAVVAVAAAIRIARSERQAHAQTEKVLAQQAKIQLAAADMGRFDLVLVPFDWDPVAQAAHPPATSPSLRWTLSKPGDDDLYAPGAAYVDGDDVRRGTATWTGQAWVETVEARAGRVFLEIDRGAGCAPSRIVIQRLPSYTERDQRREVRVNVPTCAATAAGLVPIPGGPFWRRVNAADESTSHDELATLPTYAIDRTEVTRGAFAMYGAMKDLTSDGAGDDAYVDTLVAPSPSLPAVGINYFTARNYCRFLGKDLPDVDHWQKAFRGGLELWPPDDPRSRRATVWTGEVGPRPTNVEYGADEAHPMPVGSFPGDTSPYGVIDLAGNVSEWTVVPALYDGMRVTLGANWGTPIRIGTHLITADNMRPEADVDYATGMRCVDLR